MVTVINENPLTLFTLYVPIVSVCQVQYQDAPNDNEKKEQKHEKESVCVRVSFLTARTQALGQQTTDEFLSKHKQVAGGNQRSSTE